MRTPIVLCALLSFAAGSALAQSNEAQKSILEDELAAEATQFTDAYAELREARAHPTSSERLEDITEQVDRHRRNMAELAREIARSEGDVASKGSQTKATGGDWLIPVLPGKEAHPDWLVPAGKERQ